MEMYIKYILLLTSGIKISLWPQATTFEKSERGYLQLEATTVHCVQYKQHSRFQKDYLQLKAATICCDQRPQHLKVTERLFATGGRHSFL